MLKISVGTDAIRGIAIMAVEGRVDSDSTPELEAALTGLLKTHCHKIVVNLQRVDFMSSAGLRALVRTYQEAQKAGGGVRLTAVPQDIESVMYTVGLNQMLTAYSTDQEAMAGF